MIRASSLRQTFTLAAVLAAGFAALWALVGQWGADIIRSYYFPSGLMHLQVMNDGTPLLYSYSDRYSGIEYYDLAGYPVPTPEDAKQMIGAHLPVAPGEEQRGDDWSSRLRSFADDGRPPGFWWVVADGKVGGSAYLVGYHSKSNVRLGFIGTKGFRERELPAEERFLLATADRGLNGRVVSTQIYYTYGRVTYPQSSGAYARPEDFQTWEVFLQTDDRRIYRVDLAKRTTEVMVAGVPILSCGLAMTYLTPRAAGLHYLVVRTENEVLLYNNAGQIVRQTPIPEELRGQTISWMLPPGETSLALTMQTSDVFTYGFKYQLYWIDAEGKVIRRENLDLQKPAQEYMRYLGALLMPMPLLGDGYVGLIRPLDLVEMRTAKTYSEGLKQAISEFWPSLVIVHVMALALAWLCHRREVRHGGSRAECIIWPMFVFLLGLPGWIGYRFCRSWPAIEPCPTCKQPIPRDRQKCAACQTQFPLPDLKGTEIYA